jgi:hypothetical protein
MICRTPSILRDSANLFVNDPLRQVLYISFCILVLALSFLFLLTIIWFRVYIYPFSFYGSLECINMVAEKIRRVAVIGAGPSGAITVDALVQEQAFDHIRVFDRQEGPGGCW